MPLILQRRRPENENDLLTFLRRFEMETEDSGFFQRSEKLKKPLVTSEAFSPKREREKERKREREKDRERKIERKIERER